MKQSHRIELEVAMRRALRGLLPVPVIGSLYLHVDTPKSGCEVKYLVIQKQWGVRLPNAAPGGLRLLFPANATPEQIAARVLLLL